MLTVAEETLTQLARERGKDVSVHLYGQEVNPETYAISKADLILKGEGVEADNVQFGSTLSNDAFPAREFDFMLSNPPYGKSWKTDLERMGGKSGLTDPRFLVEHDGEPDHSLITRSSDGQMMFLANMLGKMKRDTPLGSRIAGARCSSSTPPSGSSRCARTWAPRTASCRPRMSSASATPSWPSRRPSSRRSSPTRRSAVRRVTRHRIPGSAGTNSEKVLGSTDLPGGESRRGQQHVGKAATVRKRCRTGSARPARYGEGWIV